MCGDGHDHTDGGEDDTVSIGAGFIAGPGVEKGEVIYVAIDPVAVFEIIGDEAIDDLEGGKKGEKVSVVLVRRYDFVQMCVIAGLAIAIVGLSRVLEGEGLGRGLKNREKKGEYQSEMGDGRSGAGVEAAVAMAANHAGSVVFFKGICIQRFLLWSRGPNGIF